jgi:hypothetical protein
MRGISVVIRYKAIPTNRVETIMPIARVDVLAS